MMLSSFWKLTVVALLGGAAPTMTEAVSAGETETFVSATGGSRVVLRVGDSVVFDISRLIPKLYQLRADERREQVADWAAYFTVLAEASTPTEARDAMYDKVPLRLPGMDAVANLEYGAGRRVIRSGGTVALFVSSADVRRRATLARLADQVRMELGSPPVVFAVYRYRADPITGQLVIYREPNLSKAVMYSAQYGYVESVVRSAADLAEWLDAADDVTHVRLVPGGVELGGRRFADARTQSVSLEDVAALYQAHRDIQRVQDSANVLMTKRTDSLQTAWSALIDVYNANVRAANRSGAWGFSAIGGPAFTAALREVRRLTQAPTPARLQSDTMTLVDRAKQLQQFLEHAESRTLDGQRAALLRLKPQVVAAMDSLWADERARLAREGWDLAAEPGFSLDPEWNVTGIRSDIETLLNDPRTLIARAVADARGVDSTSVRDGLASHLALTAYEVVRAFSSDTLYLVPAQWKPYLHQALIRSEGASSKAAEGGALVSRGGAPRSPRVAGLAAYPPAHVTADGYWTRDRLEATITAVPVAALCGCVPPALSNSDPAT